VFRDDFRSQAEKPASEFQSGKGLAARLRPNRLAESVLAGVDGGSDGVGSFIDLTRAFPNRLGSRISRFRSALPEVGRPVGGLSSNQGTSFISSPRSE